MARNRGRLAVRVIGGIASPKLYYAALSSPNTGEFMNLLSLLGNANNELKHLCNNKPPPKSMPALDVPSRPFNVPLVFTLPLISNSPLG